MELEFSNTFEIFLNKQLEFWNLTLRPWKKVTWGLTYFDEFICVNYWVNIIVPLKWSNLQIEL